MKKLVLLFALALPLFSVGQQALTLEEAVLGKFYPDFLRQLQWLPLTDAYVYVKNDTLFQGTPKTKERALITLTQLNEWNKLTAAQTTFPQISWVDAQNFYFETEGKYIHTNIKLRSSFQKGTVPASGENIDYHGASGHLAFTKENNLFVQIDGNDIPVTKNERGIVSGQSISRNEYGIEKGTFWNNAGTALAFYQKDERDVTDYPLINFKETPAVVKYIKYPMAGGLSEKVSVGIYSVASGKTIFVDIDNGTKPVDSFYATNLKWSPDGNKLYLIWMNRATNEMQLREYDGVTGKYVKTLITERDEKWVEPLQPITFIKGKDDQFLWYSWKDGFHNYYLYNIEGKPLGQTKAKFELTQILGFSLDGSKFFVEGTGDNPTEMNVYMVNSSDLTMIKTTGIAGSHNVQISPSGDFMLDTYSSLTVPNKTDLSSSGGRSIRNVHTAKNLLEGRAIGQTEIMQITAADGTALYCRVIKPSNFSIKKKYPVLVYVYNGPHVQLVTNSWLGGASLWMNYLAEQGYIVFTLDGRGSAHRGKEFEQAIHLQLGSLELADQIKGVEYLKSLVYVDASKMAVHGWSFGGFMTTSLMLREPRTFKVGVAGGPVIDWKLYEVMYTERYMDTPAENPDGYSKADLTGYVKNLKGDLLMIHGTDDDVVVMQHNMRFLKASVEKQVQVDFFAYPGHAHNVRGKDRLHLMTKVIDYINEKLAEP